MKPGKPLPRSVAKFLDASSVAELQRRLVHTKLPSPPTRVGDADGVDPMLVSALIRRWQDFDWSERVARLNAYHHEWVEVDGLRLHAAIATNVARAGDPPLVALHGWPSTFEQMLPLADRLSAHESGMTVLAFSLPGFGFSSAPVAPGWDLQRSAAAIHRAVTILGYDRYIVRGTDYGIGVGLHLGALYPDNVVGVHVGGTHLPIPDEKDLPADLSDDERTFVDAGRRWEAEEGAYMALQATKPETIAHALSDSPAGLLAWMVEKYATWCATPQDVTRSIDPDDILSAATIYWATNSIASSLRLYREDRLGVRMPRSIAPVAVNQPVLEEYAPPHSWWNRLQPVARYSRLDGASHFPEWENPDGLADDIVAFATLLRRRAANIAGPESKQP